MRMWTRSFGFFCVAAACLAGGTSAFADLTPVQTAVIPSTQTDWNTSTPSLQGTGPGTDPLLFNKFDTSLGTLQSVNLSMTYTVISSATMTFTTASTLTLTSGFQSTPGGPLQGTTINLNLTTDPGAPTLLSVQAPVLTYTKTYDPGSGTQVFSSSNPPNSPFYLTPDGHSSNTMTGSSATTLTDSGQVAFFSGVGTIGLPALSFSGSSFSTDSGNGGGTVLTYAGISVSLSYNYTPLSVPEPSSFVLLGVALGGLLWIRRVRSCPKIA